MFDRDPVYSNDEGFIQTVLNADHGYSTYELANSLISPEFISTYGSNVSNDQFIQTIYLNALNRFPTEYELNTHYRPFFNNGTLDKQSALVNLTSYEVVQTTWDALGAEGNVGIISNDNDVYSAFGINTVSDYIEKVVTPSINREVAEKSDHFDLVFNALSKFDEATSREFISDSMQTLRFDENALAAMGLSIMVS